MCYTFDMKLPNKKELKNIAKELSLKKKNTFYLNEEEHVVLMRNNEVYFEKEPKNMTSFYQKKILLSIALEVYRDKNLGFPKAIINEDGKIFSKIYFEDERGHISFIVKNTSKLNGLYEYELAESFIIIDEIEMAIKFFEINAAITNGNKKLLKHFSKDEIIKFKNQVFYTGTDSEYEIKLKQQIEV